VKIKLKNKKGKKRLYNDYMKWYFDYIL